MNEKEIESKKRVRKEGKERVQLQIKYVGKYDWSLRELSQASKKFWVKLS